MKNYSLKDFQRLLKDNGWTHVRTNGDHLIYKKEGMPKHISVPHKQKNLCLPLARRLVKEGQLIEI